MRRIEEGMQIDEVLHSLTRQEVIETIIDRLFTSDEIIASLEGLEDEEKV